MESRKAEKQLDKAPKRVIAKYEVWKAIVEQGGPIELRNVKGFHDKSLRGDLSGFRSSRVGQKWRVIYQVIKNELYVIVEKINAHKY